MATGFGTMNDEPQIILGERHGWGEPQRFGISKKDQRQHIYIIGKTGTGKATLLQNIIVQHIALGHGVGLIDPHGDLAEEILNHIPPHRADHLVYFNPGDALLVLVIVLWIWTDKRILTQDEELEQTLIDAAKRHRRLGSMSAVLDEYRAEGASELTISRARNAGPLLRQRAIDSLRTGLLVSGIGTIPMCGCAMVLIWKTGHLDQYLLEYGLIGAFAGACHIAPD